MNLDNKQVKQSYDLWVNQSPNSIHDLDVDKFNKLVLALLENEDTITEDEIEIALGDNFQESNISYYFDKFKTMTSFYKLMLDSGYTK